MSHIPRDIVCLISYFARPHDREVALHLLGV